MNEISLVNFVVGASVCMSLVSLAPYTVRDIAYSVLPFRTLHITNYIGSELASYAFVHFLLVFPRRKRILEKFPRIVFVLYGVMGIQFLIHFTHLLETTYLTVYLPISVCLLVFLLGTV